MFYENDFQLLVMFFVMKRLRVVIPVPEPLQEEEKPLENQGWCMLFNIQVTPCWSPNLPEYI